MAPHKNQTDGIRWQAIIQPKNTLPKNMQNILEAKNGVNSTNLSFMLKVFNILNI